jgi:lipopolysaccharide transport system ATP-binding protein
MSAAITFDRVSKKFRRGEHHDSLRDLVPSIAARLLGRRRVQRGADQDFWAVSDVSFEVRPGEALGLIGPNGAGKSTILKLLTRILKPTSGTCTVRGRVGSLIEVAAGFHPDLTGRENVYLQGAIAGMPRTEIVRKFDQIVDFAGVSEFIDTPVKRFSSGMNARLGFAIAAHLDPEVLIIDEVLSVGDATFQARCITRMRELVARGVPLVSVSHNLPSILELCTHAILLNRGKVQFSGTAIETVQAYRRSVAARSATPKTPGTPIWISSVQLLDASGAPAESIRTGDPLTVRIGYDTAGRVQNPGFAVDIHHADGVYCFGTSTHRARQEFGALSGSGHVDLKIDAVQLSAGCYSLSAGIHRAGGLGGGGGLGLYDLHECAYPLTITSERAEPGLVSLPHRFIHHPENARLMRSSTPCDPNSAREQVPSVVGAR